MERGNFAPPNHRAGGRRRGRGGGRGTSRGWSSMQLDDSTVTPQEENRYDNGFAQPIDPLSPATDPSRNPVSQVMTAPAWDHNFPALTSPAAISRPPQELFHTQRPDYSSYPGARTSAGPPDFENQIRNLILRDRPEQADASSPTMPFAPQQYENPTQKMNSSWRRMGQEGREHYLEPSGPASPRFRKDDPSGTLPLRSPPGLTQRRGQPHHAYTNSRDAGNTLSPRGAYGRAQPRGGRQLYDPGPRHGTSLVSPHHQAEFMDTLVTQNVPSFAISVDEQRSYEFLRQHIHQLVLTALSQCESTHGIPTTSIQLECFGSLASGFGMSKSDMDLMLFYESQELNETQQSGIPRIVEKALLDNGHGARLLTRTRVPIIRFCSSPSQELLEALRGERLKWEEEEAKRAEEKSNEDGRQDNDSQEDDRHSQQSERHESDDEANPEEDGDPASNEATSPVTPASIEHTAESTDAKTKSPEATLSSKKSKRNGKSKKDKEPVEETKTSPPPYTNDAERIQLYHLAIKEDWFSNSEREIIKRFAAAYDAAGGNEEDESVVTARKALDVLPDVLSRYREPRPRKQALEFPEGSGLLCDINFSVGVHSNPLGVHNTRLLRCYSLFDPRIKQMVVFVKGWAKRRNINKPYHGTLSSYGYVLMVLHYVVNIVNPPLAPNLQLFHSRNADTSFQAPEVCGEYDIRFWQDPQAIKHASAFEFGQNTQSVGSLLVGFFRYYAVPQYRGMKGFEWMKDVLSLRTPGGLLSKQEKGWTGKWTQSSEVDDAVSAKREITHRYLLAIEDPFEHSHNVGRPVMHHGIVAIREEFRRANQMIINGCMWNGKVEDLLAPGASHEKEQLLFGPNPKFRREKPQPFGPKNLVGEERVKALEKAREEERAERKEKDTQTVKQQEAENSENKSSAHQSSKDLVSTTPSQKPDKVIKKDKSTTPTNHDSSGPKKTRRRHPNSNKTKTGEDTNATVS